MDDRDDPGATDAESKLADLLAAAEAALRADPTFDVERFAASHPEQGPELLELLRGLALLEGAGAALSAPGQPAPPTRLDRFEIEREVGRGGMGIVYLARDPELGRLVALKVLASGARRDPSFLARFKREALAAARLQHRGIVAVYEAREEQGQHFYVMQYVEGATLEELLEAQLVGPRPRRAEGGVGPTSKPAVTAAELVRAWTSRAAFGAGDAAALAEPRLTFAEVARIVAESAEALQHAHAAGVLHRDVKPANIIVDHAGAVRVMDFGVCHVVGGHGLTLQGDFVGTLRYSAPEQVEGHSDERSDVYSLGLVLRELLTLAPTFTSTGHAALLREVLYTEPRAPRRIRREIPTDLETIALKASAKLPAERYPSAGALARDLRAYVEGMPITARRPSAMYLARLFARRHRALVALAVGAVAALAALGALYVSDLRAKDRELTRRSYAAHLAAARAALAVGAVSRARLHLDQAPPEHRGWEWSHTRALTDQSLRHEHVFPGRRTSGCYLCVSPVGGPLLIADSDGVALWDPDRGASLATIDVPTARSLCWSPDGARFAVGTNSGQLQVFEASVPPRRIADIAVGDEVVSLECVADGSVLFGTWDGLIGRWRDGQAKAERVHTSTGHVVWVGSGRIGTLGDADTAWFLTHLGELGRVDGAVCESVEARAGGRVSQLLAFDRGAGTVDVMDVDGGTFRFLVANGDVVGRRFTRGNPMPQAAFDPERNLTAFRSEQGHVLVVTRGEEHVTTRLARGHSGPIWAAAYDPRRDLVHSSDVRGDLLTWDLRAMGGERVFEGHFDDVWAIDLHPDGRHMVSGARDGLVVVWDIDRAEPMRVLPECGNAVTDVCFLPGSLDVAATGGDGHLRIFDVVRGEPRAVAPLRGHRGHRVVVDPTSQALLVLSDAGLERFDDRGHPLGGPVALPEAARALARVGAAPGADVVVGMHGGDLARLAPSTGAVVWRAPACRGGVVDLAVDAARGIVAAVDETSQVALLRLRDGARVATLDASGGGESAERLLCVAIGPGPDRIVASDSDGTYHIWAGLTVTPVASFDAHGSYATALEVDQARGRVATGGSDCAIRIWSDDDAREVHARRDAAVLTRDEARKRHEHAARLSVEWARDYGWGLFTESDAQSRASRVRLVQSLLRTRRVGVEEHALQGALATRGAMPGIDAVSQLRWALARVPAADSHRPLLLACLTIASGRAGDLGGARAAWGELLRSAGWRGAATSMRHAWPKLAGSRLR
ncbi:MAG: protein kinase [Planctomycetota bacterium]